MEHSLLDLLWVIMASALVFVMQAGFAMVESGLTRSKNSINVAIKNLTDFGVSLMVFWLVGFGLMFGPSLQGIIGSLWFGYSPTGAWHGVFLLFQAMFCSTAATIVSGAVAERMRFGSYIVVTIILSVVVYPVFGHWAWGGALEASPSGWLARAGFVDFAGSTVVHSLGGWISLAALLVLGPRTGRFGADGRVRDINGSSIPQAVLGVFLLWFGWMGFNGGSTLAANEAVGGIILRTMLAGAAGMVVTLGAGWALSRKPDVGLVLNGSLAGLVAVTASCHAVSEVQAVLIGGVGGLVMLGLSALLRRWRIDDAVDAVPVHLGAGIWGTLAVGIFGDPARLGTGLDQGAQLGVQLLGILACGGFCLGLGYPALRLLNRFLPLRVTADDEHQGLNKAEHGVSTEINDLYHVLDTQARTGDLALRAPVEPFTEAGQIAGMYNAVLDRLQEGTVEKGEYLNILQNVSDGLFLLDRSLEIGPFHSASLMDIFRTRELAGRSIISVLESFLDEKSRLVTAEFLDVAFDASIAWRNAAKLNPLKEAEAHFDNRQGGFDDRILEFHFTRILDERSQPAAVERLLVLVRDVTERRELAEQVEKARSESRQEMEMLQRILHVEPGTLNSFLGSVRHDARAINEELKSGSPDLRGRLDAMFRHSHAIKGDAELLQLDFLVDHAEALEERIQQLRGAPFLEPEDFLPLAIGCSELLAVVARLENLLDKWLRLSETMRTGIGGGRDLLKDALEAMTGRLAARYGKQVRLDFRFASSDLVLEPARQKALKDILVQLIRNAVYHGIEHPSMREARGKPGQGTIRISLEKTGQFYRLQVQDDGGGLDLEAIKAKAVTSGIMDQVRAQAMDEKEASALIFHPGFSTAANPDTVAGKGIGMSLVRSQVRELGGQLQLKTRRGLFCAWLILIPVTARTPAGVAS